MKKFISIIFISFSLLISCSTESSVVVDDAVKVEQEFRNTAPSATLAPTGKTETEHRIQRDVQKIQTEILAPETAYNPNFQDCAGLKSDGLRDAEAARKKGDIRGPILCMEENLRVLVQDYIDALNNGDFNLVKKYIDEKSLTEITPIFEEKSKKISSDSLNLTWEDEGPPAKRGSKRASVFINVTAENFSERWLVEFLEVGTKGGGIWYISSVSYDK